MKTASLAGIWTVSADDGAIHNLRIPGTLDESNIGHRDKKNPGKGLTEPQSAASGLDRVFTEDELVYAEPQEPDPDENIYSRFTRKYTYEGAVRISRMLNCVENPEKRLFVDVERARLLSLQIDGEEIMPFRSGTLLSEQSFEVTGKLDGSHILSFISDNSYPGLPRAAILRSNMASDDTQTNWNGLLGYVRLREEEACFVDRAAVFVQQDGTLSVSVDIACSAPGTYELVFSSPALVREYRHEMQITQPFVTFTADGLQTAEDLALWDIDEGNLYELTVSLNGEGKTVSFGARGFTADDTHLFLNGKQVFLRGQTDCSVYPETSYAPMDKGAWLKKLSALKAYGVNFVRFHSYCPPEAAFLAADELGMLLMPELSLAGPADVFAEESARRYYRSELLALLRSYGSHPSFVMLSLGDRLRFSEESLDFAAELLELARRADPTRLYTLNSGEPADEHGLALSEAQEKVYFSAPDFLMTPREGVQLFRGTDYTTKAEQGLKGFVNCEYPGTLNDYDEDISLLREKAQKPLVSCQAGGYSMLPDFREISYFSGYLEPGNLVKMRDDVEREGLQNSWEKLAEISGETAANAYRMEVERALRSRLLAGIVLFSLQDYPGRETALVGMMNSHLLPKPYPFAEARRFRTFFGPLVPLVRTERFCYEAGETLRFTVSVSNSGREDLRGAVSWTLKSEDGIERGETGKMHCPAGMLTDFEEEFSFPLLTEDAKEPARFVLTVRFAKAEQSYPIYVYPRVLPICPMDVYECSSLDQTAILMLKEGGKVFLSPGGSQEVLPASVRSQFSTDFISSRIYPRQSGEMGRLIDTAHPVTERFLSDEWGGLQWWQMARGRAVVLPRRMKCVVAALDSVHTLRPMAEMVEFRCLSGSVFLCSMELKSRMDRPEVRFLVSEIYRYLGSYDFSPSQELKLSELQMIVKP